MKDDDFVKPSTINWIDKINMSINKMKININTPNFTILYL